MKYILNGFLLILGMAMIMVILFGFNYILDHEDITVLEISIVEGYGDSLKYRVSYVGKSLHGKHTSSIDFKTLLGVENYLNEVADHDLSQWRAVKND